jgi:hypothetical protein
VRRAHRKAHAAVWAALALALPAVLVAAFALRGANPESRLVERLPEAEASQ